ncbi:ergothioneine biosynthesis protein EgtB [Lichenicoccus roseus]|uniref:ergothioneine biosynthesis protein EgtB n=1 Tax=Lichenicoccus roseus TaxID=2683649 RepID=UPI0014874CBF|nr:ergothioneine biosynthesis protein EgtB [Lichenicoccus roseus]
MSQPQSRPNSLRQDLAERCRAVRTHTEHLASGLSPEDQCVQSMPDASPAKWHRAHTTWFFEQFVLGPNLPGYRAFDPAFPFLFNSYYDAVGPRHPRTMRGLLTRPDAAHVGAYRAHVDAALETLLQSVDDPSLDELVTLGLHHEQQHQELLITDALHALAQNPLAWVDDGFAVLPGWTPPARHPGPTRFIERSGGLVGIGHTGGGFGFDNEYPRHQQILLPHALANRLVRNGEWLEFMRDDGYARADLWMSDGWGQVSEQGWNAPLHWRPDGDGGWRQVNPGGCTLVDPDAPVTHVSWYEADAYARWAGARLPTEAELEAAQPDLPEFFGHAWQWTGSAYLAYPRFKPVPGAIGEYNGKFMINQMVLRGSSYATSPGHERTSYRNFFQPEKRWQVTGLRLAQDR